MAEVAKALGDPIRLQLVDVLRKHAGNVCVCELVPLFDISQGTLSHHLKKLRDAGIGDSERICWTSADASTHAGKTIHRSDSSFDRDRGSWEGCLWAGRCAFGL